MILWSKRNRRRQSRQSPWQMVLERLESRSLLSATITPAAQTPFLEDTTKVISGLLVDPMSIGPVTLTLSVTDGTLTVTDPLIGGVRSVQISGSGTNTVQIAGSVMDVNETLASGLKYIPRANFFGSDTLVINLNDLTDTDNKTIDLMVVPDRKSVV